MFEWVNGTVAITNGNPSAAVVGYVVTLTVAGVV